MAVKPPYKYSSLEYADDFFKKILDKLGAPYTEGNMIFMKAWRQAEGGSAIYNPWNTIQGGYPGNTKYNDDPGVKNYTRVEDGIDATYKTMTNGIYPNIVAALKKGIKDKTEAYNLAVELQQQGKDLWAWVRGPYSKSSNLPGYVAAVLGASKISGRGIPIPLDSNSPSSSQTKIKGNVKDENGQPVKGATVKVTPPVKYPDTPFKNSTESDEFRKWLLDKYPEYETKPKPYNVDPPPQPDITNSEALKKAWAEKGSEYDNTAVSQPESQQAVNNPAPLPPKTPTYIVYRKKEDGTTAPDGAIIKFEESGPQKTAILTPTDPNISNAPIKGYPSFVASFDLLADLVLGTYKDLLSSYYGSIVLEPGRVFIKKDEITTPTPQPSTPKPDEQPTTDVTIVTDENGNWEMEAPSTFDPKGSTITFSKEGHEIREITNIQQTGGDIVGEEGKQYDLPRVTMSTTPNTTDTATNKLNQEILTEETSLIKQQGESELSAQEKLANLANKQKEELKKTIIPFIIKLLAQFGGVALQAILSKIPLDKIKDQISCPSQAKILELTNKRNKLVKQVNNAYKTVTTLTKTIRIVDSTLTAIQAGIAVIEALPYPATGIPPLGLPPLTSGIIETTGSGKDKLKESLKKAKVVINIVTLALASFGAILGIVLRLLNNLDVLIQQCAQEQDVPFEAINNELNTFINQSTDVNNSNVIQSTQDNNTYKGFTLEIKLDETNSIKYPRRFAQALNKIGIPVLKTDSSFASDAQVLIDQLKFIIDSNPQLTAE